MEVLQNDITLFNCDATTTNVIKTLLSEFPTINESIKCSNQDCKIFLSAEKRPISCITFQTKNGQIQELQQFLNKRLCMEKLKCTQKQNYLSSHCTGFQNIEYVIASTKFH